MKKIALIVMVCVASINCYCINGADTLKTKKNSIIFELGGKGLLYSINYDRTIPFSENFGSLIGIGFCVAYIYASSLSAFIPMLMPEVGVYYGKTHKIEMGYSIEILEAIVHDGEIRNNFRVGYRYQRSQGGLLFRANYFRINRSESIGLSRDLSNFDWVGISVGYAF